MSDMGIYKITNTVNGKVYIGQSVRLSRRLDEHQAHLKNNHHHNQHLQNSYNKYGNVFEIEIIEYCDDELELDDLERYYIAYYEAMNPTKGYNKENGGNLNKHMSEESRRKMSESSKGKTFSEETRKKMSESTKGENHPMYGKTHLAETRKKISESVSEAHKSKSGFYRVCQHKDKCCKQGFVWWYRYTCFENKKRKIISSTNLLKLKEKVETQGLPWKIIDNKKAQKSLELNNKYHKGEKND